MVELLLILIPIVVVDAMNPVLAAAVIFALGTRRPYRAASWVLFGWFAVYFLAGIGLAVGLERITGALASPRPIDFVIQTPIALGLIWFAYKSARDSEHSKADKRVPQAGGSNHTLGVFAGILLGATINLVGLPFALLRSGCAWLRRRLISPHRIPAFCTAVTIEIEVSGAKWPVK